MKEIEIYLCSMKGLCPQILDEHLEAFKTELKIRKFRRGEVIFIEGEWHESIQFVTSGLVRAFYNNEKGQERNAWFVKEFEFVTDYPCFLNGCKSHYSFQCLEDTVTVELPKAAIYKAYSRFSSINNYGRLIAEEVLKMMQGRIENLLFLDARERYQEIMISDPELVSRISIGHLASYLGIERQTLTRIRKDVNYEN